MKITTLILCIILLFSCSENEKSLQPLKVEAIGHIPYLMYEKEIDSVYEIITRGEVYILTAGDTLNHYYRVKDNRIECKMRSFMCCSYVYEFDSLGLLSYHEIFSDVKLEQNFERYRVDDTIFENSIEYRNSFKYKIENELITKKMKLFDSNYSEIKVYKYDENRNLAKTINTFNLLEGSKRHDKEIHVYNYDDEKLISSKIYNLLEPHNDTIIRIETIYDNEEFPKKKRVIKNHDTLYETVIIRN